VWECGGLAAADEKKKDDPMDGREDIESGGLSVGDGIPLEWSRGDWEGSPALGLMPVLRRFSCRELKGHIVEVLVSASPHSMVGRLGSTGGSCNMGRRRSTRAGI